jgi:hypothetical protein
MKKFSSLSFTIQESRRLLAKPPDGEWGGNAGLQPAPRRIIGCALRKNGRLMMTGLLHRGTNHLNHLRKNRHDCLLPTARREIRLHYSRHLAALRGCHLRYIHRPAALRDCHLRCNPRRSVRCAEKSKSHLLAESRQAAAY